MTGDKPTRVPSSARRSATLPPIPADYARLEQLYEIQTVLARSVDIQRACDELLPLMARVLEIRTAVLIDTTQELARTLMWAAEGVGAAELDHAQARAQATLAYLAPARAVSTHAASHIAVLRGGVSDQRTANRSYVVLPIMLVRGEVFGVFQIEGATTFDEADLLFINAVAGQIAVRLDRHHAMLLLRAAQSEVERASSRLNDLQTISKAALESSELHIALPTLLEAIRTMFSCDAASVLLASEDGRTLRRDTNVGAEHGGESTVAVDTGILGLIAAGTSALRFDNLNDVVGTTADAIHDGMHSLVGAPLRVRDRLTGVVYIASRTQRAFTQENLTLLELIAGRIANTIENAALYERALVALRARDVVLGMVSHDLKNPLGSIHLAAEVIGDDPRHARPVSIIRRAVMMMGRLIDDMRDIGSIEAGHFSVNRRVETALSIVKDAVDDLQSAASEKRIRLEILPPARPLIVSCDRHRVIQVMTNLLTNAIKFTQAQGVIEVTVDETPGYARVSVSDNGCGIAAHDLGHVFDRYWQAASTAHLGTGLGLAISKGIIHAHGGAISVTSRVGVGTTFSFTIPLEADPPAS
ncbi:hypothetical protein BH11MYX2_BH11MYX2_10280 [soil metagenome]